MTDRLTFDNIVNSILKKQSMEGVERQVIAKTLESFGELMFEHDSLQLAWEVRLKVLRKISNHHNFKKGKSDED